MSDQTANRDDEEGLSPDDKIIREAKRRFGICEDWEGDAQKNWVADYKFANADATNLYQWPQDVRQSRELDDRPCLTINKTRQHCLQIINDAKQNKPSVKIKPIGNGATYEASQVFEGVVRHIEYISNAQSAYDTATTYQVMGGIGYWRVVTDYAGDDTFDQEIFIRRVKDPLSVYLDPDIREADGSDAAFGFIFDDMERKDFNRKYPKFKGEVGASTFEEGDTWIREDQIRVAEYYRRVPKKDRLMAFTDPQSGQQVMARESKVPKEILDLVVDNPATQFRDIQEDEIEWFLIAGDKIIERNIWPGRYIPIVRVVGEETVIDGELDRKGHTRAMIDPQRVYNYWTSAAVEQVALQGKSPYIGPLDAFEGLETHWQQANTTNFAYLPYNQYDDKGMKLEPPARQAPPVMSAAYIQGMQISSQEIKEVSGQFQAELGMQSNETSGVAIQQRQRQGDNATYHYIDNLAMGIRFTGKILIDLIPKIYDTPRIIKIMAEDGVEHQVTIDPKAQAAYLEKQKEQKEVVEGIFNPNVGKYDVEADIGPAYATRRQEAFNAFMQIAAQNKDLMHIAGDLMFKAADFPMADELAERLKRLIPPQVMGEAPPPEVQQMSQQLQHMQGLLMNTMQELADAKRDLKAKDEQKQIDEYKALTDRIKVLLPTVVNPKDIAVMVHDMMMAEHSSNLDLANTVSAQAVGQMLQPNQVSQSQGQPEAPMNAPDEMAA